MQLSSKAKVSLVVVGSLAIGVLLGSTVLSNVLNTNTSGKVTDGLYLSGTETIKVVAPDGKVVSTWTGPDPLTNIAVNAIAACIPGSVGGSTDPVGPASTPANGSCSSFINGVAIVFAPASYPFIGGTCSENAGAETENGFSVTGCQANAAATNILTPLGCDPNAGTPAPTGPLCSGWITQATFGPTTFTATNCIYDISQTPCAVLEAGAGPLSQMANPSYGIGNAAFDILTVPTPISVAAGDSMLVTIQFTVS